MIESADQLQWRKDAQDLAKLGTELAGQDLPRIEVRISASVAAMAVAAWERDDEGPMPPEDFEQRIIRGRAGALALDVTVARFARASVRDVHSGMATG